MCKKLICLLSFVLVFGLCACAVEAGTAYPAPDAWWTYIYTGGAAAGGDPDGTQGYNALDGTWSHENGSDEWDNSQIGAGSPGGIIALTEGDTKYLRLQETGDPRSHGMDDPSNRKLYFGHSITNDIGAIADNILDDGVTISFRARIPTEGPLDNVHSGGTPTPWSAGGDGYVLHDGGKDCFGVRQPNGDMLISFALALASDDDELSVNGLVMNDLNGNTPTDNVDQQDNDGGTLNIFEIADPTVWHEFWITIQADETGTGTHLVRIYMDGSLEPEEFYVTAGTGNDYDDSYIALGLGATPQSGALDVDFFAYHEGILSPTDIEKAGKPIPANNTIIEETWTNLSWVQGAYAVSHDVYVGDNFDDVDAGAESTFQGNQTTTFIIVGFPGFPFPDGLIPGTTYYWRIDEVEADGTTKKGNIWNFMVAPRTAYNSDPADGAESVDVNVKLSWTAGFGAKLHTVYFGDNFDDVNNATGGLPQGAVTYDPGPLQLSKTYYWRVDEFDAVDTYKGQVWSFTTEGAVGSPEPANGAVDVKQTPTLSWVPGVFAASHQVYFGADKDAVRNADTGSPEYKGVKALGSESYDPGKLEWNSTYYWRIDEVNDTNPDSPWKGNVWSFTTANFLVIDDFEDYDIGNNEIWWAWIDGLGYASHPTLPAHPGNGTGSMVGDETTGSYMEETIVHGGGKSMPVFYDNNQQGKLKYSEVELTLTDSRDWTENGVNRLTIWFRGNPDNAAEPLYVALNGSAVVTNDNPEAAQATRWTEWNIDLQLFADQGVNLTNVNTLALGLGDKKNPLAGGSGTMYFDDIRLYPPPPEPEPAP